MCVGPFAHGRVGGCEYGEALMGRASGAGCMGQVTLTGVFGGGGARPKKATSVFHTWKESLNCGRGS